MLRWLLSLFRPADERPKTSCLESDNSAARVLEAAITAAERKSKQAP